MSVDSDGTTRWRGVLSGANPIARVVWNMLKEGMVHLGVSVGGKINGVRPGRDAIGRTCNLITDVRLDELSITDNPANRLIESETPDNGAYITALAKSVGNTMLARHQHYIYLNGVPYTAHPSEEHGIVLRKAGRRRAPSPGQLGLFGGHNEGDTKVEGGVTYRLNANSRWERMDKPKASGKPSGGKKKAEKPAIVPVVEAEKRAETPAKAKAAKPKARRQKEPKPYLEDQSPSILAAELDKIKNFLALADAGLVSITPRKRKQTEAYLKQVKDALFEITKPDDDAPSMSDNDLLQELGVAGMSDDDLMRELGVEPAAQDPEPTVGEMLEQQQAAIADKPMPEGEAMEGADDDYDPEWWKESQELVQEALDTSEYGKLYQEISDYIQKKITANKKNYLIRKDDDPNYGMLNTTRGRDAAFYRWQEALHQVNLRFNNREKLLERSDFSYGALKDSAPQHIFRGLPKLKTFLERARVTEDDYTSRRLEIAREREGAQTPEEKPSSKYESWLEWAESPEGKAVSKRAVAIGLDVASKDYGKLVSSVRAGFFKAEDVKNVAKAMLQEGLTEDYVVEKLHDLIDAETKPAAQDPEPTLTKSLTPSFPMTIDNFLRKALGNPGREFGSGSWRDTGIPAMGRKVDAKSPQPKGGKKVQMDESASAHAGKGIGGKQPKAHRLYSSGGMPPTDVFGITITQLTRNLAKACYMDKDAWGSPETVSFLTDSARAIAGMTDTPTDPMVNFVRFLQYCTRFAQELPFMNDYQAAGTVKAMNADLTKALDEFVEKMPEELKGKPLRPAGSPGVVGIDVQFPQQYVIYS
jgi:hypothetical protein